MLDNVRYVLAIELMSAVQAIDLREAALGPAGRATYDIIRSVVPFMTDDDVLSTGIEAVHKLIATGDLLAAVDQGLGRQASRTNRTPSSTHRAATGSYP
jgi:histidine ammonia-lyase